MIDTLDGALGYLADRSNYSVRMLRQDQLQRRSQVIDLYGVELSAQGDAQHDAEFFVSITPDQIYIERFEFKIGIQPFVMTVGNSGVTNTTQLTAGTSIGNTSLSGTVSGNNVQITPNPHNHTATTSITPNPHNHALTPGLTTTASNISNVRVFIDDIDITSYLMMQYPNWINGEGIYPNGRSTDNYDMISVAGLVYPWQRGVIMSSGFKTIRISANGVYNAKLWLYLKLNHVNR